MIQAFLLAGSILCTPAADDVASTDIMPENSFLFFEANDLSGMLERMSKTPAGKMIFKGKDPNEMLKPMIADSLSERGIELDDMRLPDHVAGALYWTFDDEIGVEVPAWMARVGWKDDEAMAKGIFEEIMSDLDDKAEMEELRGRDMIVFESKLELPDMDAMMMEVAPIPMMGDTSHMDDAIRRVFVVRDGSELLMSSEPVSLDDALKILDGGKGKMLSESEAYEMLDGMIPVESADLRAALLTSNFADEMKAVVGPMMGMATPLIQSAFGDIAGYGFWMKAASEGNLVEYGTNIGMNGEPVGLMELVSLAKPMSDIPAYVSAEAVTYGRIDFDFKNLVPTIQQIISSLPEAQAAQIQPMIQMYAPMMQGSLETMGPEVHIFTTITDDELAPTRMTMAIPTSDPESMNQLLSMFGPMMSMQPRDFKGDTIYSDPQSEFSRTAIGIGAGAVLFGDIDGVEAVLRSSGQSDLPTMARSKFARSAMASANFPSGDLLAWGLFDTARMIADLKDLEGSMGFNFTAMVDSQDAEEFSKAIGPGWMYGKRVDDGLQFHFGYLEPAE
jgi:hypothetical protein